MTGIFVIRLFWDSDLRNFVFFTKREKGSILSKELKRGLRKGRAEDGGIYKLRRSV